MISTDKHYHIYPKYLYRQAYKNNAHPDQRPENVASDRVYIILLIKQFSDTCTDNHITKTPI